MEEQNRSIILRELLTRSDYLVTQANDLAKAFGNLSSFEHKILDYCMTFVNRDDVSDSMYQTDCGHILKYLNLTRSGNNYKRVANAFKSLNKTRLYIKAVEADGKRSIIMTPLFDHVKIIESGVIEFRYSRDITPFVFELKNKYYSFKLDELSRIKSKYSLILLKLWNANTFERWNYENRKNVPMPRAIINGSLQEWEEWFLGHDEDDNPIEWPAGKFKQKVLGVAINELESRYPNAKFKLVTWKNGRTVVGYELKITPIENNSSLTEYI